MRTKALIGVCVAMVITVCAPSAVAQSERILNYHAHLAVSSDGWLTVTETIRVYATGNQIKRGIYRDIPIRYRLGWGLYMDAPLAVVRIERDGKTEPYHTTREGICRRIYVGRENALLTHGEHVFKLTYRIGRMIHANEDSDELYFNGTGQYWDFPIDQATVTVALPRGIPIKDITHRAHTGKPKDEGDDYSSAVDQAGQVRFEVTRPLSAGEGMTVVVTWPKGFVAVQPTAMLDIIRGNVALVIGVIGTLVVLVYYVIAWSKVGRDPQRGIIIPLFDPPKGLGPAAVRYVGKMGYNKACFTATIIQLAVARYLRIEDDDGEYTLVSLGDASSDLLTGVERVVGRNLVDGDDRLTMKQSNHATFQKAIKALKEELAITYKGKLFFSNTLWFVVGALLSVLTLGGVVLCTATLEGSPGVGFLAVWLSFWTFGVIMLTRAVIGAWRQAARSGKDGLTRKGGALFLTLFAIPFFAAEVVVLVLLFTMTSFWLAPLLLVLGGLNAWFCHLLKRPTVEGRAAMDHIEGFRMYLATAEQDLLNSAHPPEKTPELFERFLPYAVALDVETEWAAKFEDVLTAAQAEGGYQPIWYHGAAFSTIGTVGLASAMGSSMSSALSSASSAPSSSSGGSGGGGFSGGGGGGGGGGGW